MRLSARQPVSIRNESIDYRQAIRAVALLKLRGPERRPVNPAKLKR